MPNLKLWICNPEWLLMAYHQVIAVMKNQAPFFDLKQEDLDLADIEPESDLI